MKWALSHRHTNRNRTLQSFTDRFFDEFFDWDVSSAHEWLPRTDIKETDSGYELHLDVPGITEKEINVTLENDVLTISGEKKEENEEREDGRIIASERRFGSFTRSFSVPKGIKSDEVNADYKNGVLTIELPKSEEAENKKIIINVH